MGAQSYPIFLKIKQKFTELNLPSMIKSVINGLEAATLPSSCS